MSDSLCGDKKQYQCCYYVCFSYTKLGNQGCKGVEQEIMKSMKIFTYVQMINMSKNRKHSKHGLHRNGLGKDWITSNLATEIRKLFSPKNTNSPIILNWKDRSENQNQGVYYTWKETVRVPYVKEVCLIRGSDINNKDYVNCESDHIAHLNQDAEQHTSIRKKPRIRSSFLWI